MFCFSACKYFPLSIENEDIVEMETSLKNSNLMLVDSSFRTELRWAYGHLEELNLDYDKYIHFVTALWFVWLHL